LQSLRRRFRALHTLLLLALVWPGLYAPAAEAESPVERLLLEGSYAEAESAARDALAAAEAAGGADSLEAARAIDALIPVLRRLGKSADSETRELADRAVAIKEASLPPTDPDLATSLFNLGLVLTQAKAKDGPEDLLSRALEIREAALGPEDPGVAEVLATQAYRLLLSRKPDEARPLLERSLRIREKAYGPDHQDVSDTLYFMSYVEQFSGDNQGALKMRERILGIREKVYGPDHPEVAWALHILGESHLLQSKTEGVRPMLERAVAIFERTYGSDHSSVLDVLNNLALALQGERDLEGARAIHRRVLEALERTNGVDHVSTLATWMNLGSLEVALGDDPKAKEAFERALAIAEREKAPPGSLARQLHNLALVTKASGDLDEARDMYERALLLMEEARGPEHPQLAQILGQYAQLLHDQGELVEARRAHERALEILEKAHGPDHRLVAYNRANLGEAFWSLGDRAAARRELERSLDTLERVAGEESWGVEYVLRQLGSLLGEMGETTMAREHLERALAMERHRKGPDVGAGTLIRLAKLPDSQGDLDEVRRLHEKALASREKTWGPDHPDVAESLVSLAKLHRDSGDPEFARPLLQRALKIQQDSFGPLHPAVGRTEISLAELHWTLGDHIAALEGALRGEEIVRNHLELTMRSLSERRALGFAADRASGIDLALSVALGASSTEAVTRAWDAVIRSRAVVLDEMATRHRSVGLRGDAEVARLSSDLARARARLAHFVVRGPDSDHPERYRPTIERAILEKEQAERALAEKSKPFRDELARGRAGWAEIVEAIPSGSAFVAFVRYDRSAVVIGKKDDSSVRTLEITPSYAALLRPIEGEPSIIPLGAARTIDPLVSAWRKAARTKPPAARPAARRAELRYREAGEALRRAIWDPVSGKLGTTRRVFVVPAGAIHLVNLATLPVRNDRYLVESGPALHILSAERDLVRAADRKSPGKSLLAIGAPDFDIAPGPPAVAGTTPEVASLIAWTGELSAEEAYRGAPASCESFREQRFAPLPASRDEVEEIAGLWGAHLGGKRKHGSAITLTGPSAHEATFKRLAPGQRVIHLATHGFFLGGGCRSALDPPAARGTGPASGIAIGDNPLLLSGLALAGINRRDDAGGDLEDGVLTAEEIASLDLRGVEWVVLSACETGLGEVRPREGVLGLRRAFRVAGAGSLIMSLWSVQDEAAREWMRNLYGSRSDGQSTIDAVRRASVEMINTRRRRGRSTHPFYWGAFMAAGDWR
jgi:CHAT domain-containing protein/Tfp pilus assembly protein PilF